MPALIATGFFILYLLVAGVCDKHQATPRRIDPMSVPEVRR